MTDTTSATTTASIGVSVRRFYDFQPDLNTSHPEVREEIKRIMGYWLELGVSGFRVDALPFVISTKGPNVKRHEQDFDFLREMREFLQWREGDALLLARSERAAG